MTKAKILLGMLAILLVSSCARAQSGGGGGHGGAGSVAKCNINTFGQWLVTGTVIGCAPNLAESDGTLSYIGSGGISTPTVSTTGAGAGEWVSACGSAQSAPPSGTVSFSAPSSCSPGVRYFLPSGVATDGQAMVQSSHSGTDVTLAFATVAGSGTVNSGTGLAYYPSSGTTVSGMGSDFGFASHTITAGSAGILDLNAIASFYMPSTNNTTANGVTASWVAQGGQDFLSSAANNTIGGGVTIRGANVGDAGGTNGNTGGAVNIFGGDNAAVESASAISNGGALHIRPGATTDGASGGNPIPGQLVIGQTFRKGSTYTNPGGVLSAGGGLGQVSGHNTVSDNTGSGFTVVGLNKSTIASTGAEELLLGEGVALSTGTGSFTQGDIVCSDPSDPSHVVDNGSTPCPCPQTQVGFVLLSNSGFTTRTILFSPRGCIPAFTATTNNFVTGITATTGAVTHARPDSSNLTGVTIGPTVNTALNDDVICAASNVSPYTCASSSTTETFFSTLTTIPTAATASLIDGTHHGVRVSTSLDITEITSAGATTLRLNACSALASSTSCTGRVTLATLTIGGSVGAISQAGTYLDCTVLTGGTATTLVSSCIGQSPKTIQGVTGTSISTSVPNSGINWVLVWSVQFATGQNDAAALTSQVATLIP